MLARLLPLVLCALSGVFIPQAAEAQRPRVAIMEFAGPQGRALHGQVVASFSEAGQVELVADRDVREVMRRNGLRALNAPLEFQRVGQPLGLTAVVQGRVSRRRRRWVLTVQARRATDGTVLARTTWTGRTVGALSVARRNAWTRLAPGVLGGAPAAAAPPTNNWRTAPQPQASPNNWRTAPQPQGPAAPAPAQVAAASEGNAPWYASGQTVDAPGPVEAAEEPDHEEDAEPEDEAAPYTAFEVSIVGGTLMRSMVAQADVNNQCPGRSCRSESDGQIVPEERSYVSTAPGHGELGTRIELYPGALLEGQPFPWLGLFGEFRHSVGLSSVGCQARPQAFEPCTDADRMELGTSQFEAYGGAKGRFRFIDVRGGPELAVEAAFGTFAFAFDLNDLRDIEVQSVIPPLHYLYVHLGASASWGFLYPYLSAGVRFAYRLGLGVGEAGQRVWGVNTTGFSGLFLGLDLTSEMPYVLDGLFIRLTAELLRFTTAWQGQTACLVPGCSPDEPWEQWPSSGSTNNVVGGILGAVDDDYLRVSLAVGYAFR